MLGPLTKRVDDITHLFKIFFSNKLYDQVPDLQKMDFNEKMYNETLTKKLRIGVMTGANIIHGQNPSSLWALAEAKLALEKLGHEVVEFEIDHLEKYLDTFKWIVLNVMAHWYKSKLVEVGENLPLYQYLAYIVYDKPKFIANMGRFFLNVLGH